MTAPSTTATGTIIPATARLARSLLAAILLAPTPLSAAAPPEPCRADAPAIVELGATLAAAGPADRAALLHRRGQMLQARGQDGPAKADYDAALALAPDLAAVYLDRAALLADQTRFGPALADLERAIGIRPDFSEAYVGRGGVHYELGAYPSAIQDFTRAVELDPETAAAWLGRANALRDSGQAGAALADYDVALELAPDDAEIWFERAVAQHRLTAVRRRTGRLDPGDQPRPGPVLALRHRLPAPVPVRGDPLRPPDRAPARAGQRQGLLQPRRGLALPAPLLRRARGLSPRARAAPGLC